MKTILKIAILAALVGSLIAAVVSCENNKTARLKAERNIEALTSEVEQFKTSEGRNAAKMQGLEVKYSSLQEVNADLAHQVEQLGVKLKNATAAAHVESAVEYSNPEPIEVEVIENKVNLEDVEFPSIRSLIKHRDKWVDFSIEIDMSSKTIVPSGFKFKTNAPLDMAFETQYKGWWLWRRAAGVKVYASTANPYVHISEIAYYQLE